jgi:hypothetical protein
MRKIAYIVALLLGSASVYAQEDAGKSSAPAKDSRNKLHVGLKVGLNRSTVFDTEGDFAATPKIGFAGGVFGAIPIGKFLGIHPEVLLSQKGFRANGNYLGESYEMRRTTTYLDVPLLGAFKPATFLTFVGGPQYSYLFKQTDLFTSSSSIAVQEEEFQNEDVRKNILSGVAGLDINVRNLVISGRYCFDLQRNNADGSADVPRYKNVWFQGTIGYRF